MSPRVAAGIFTATLLCATETAAQAIYKAVDDEGRVTYTDQPAGGSTLHRSPRRSARQVEVDEAARRLKQAQLARTRGAEPRPGERTRSAGAGSVNYGYWQRQERLRRVVEEAQRRSNEAQRLLAASH